MVNMQECTPHARHTRRYLVCSLKSDGRATKCSTSRERPYVVSLAFIYILFVSLWGSMIEPRSLDVSAGSQHIYIYYGFENEIREQKKNTKL